MRIHKSLLVLAGLILAAAGHGAAPPKPKPTPTPTLPVTANSTYSSGHSALLAFDGNTQTGWGSYKQMEGKPLWLQFDFGKPVPITQINILWGKPCPAEFEIQIGDRLDQLKTVRQGKRADTVIIHPLDAEKLRYTDREVVKGLNATARFVRIIGTRMLVPEGNFFIQEVEFPDPGNAKIIRDRIAAALKWRDDTERPAMAEARRALQERGVRQIVFAAHPVVKEHWYANFGYYAAEESQRDMMTPRPWREGAALYRYDLAANKLQALLADPKGGIRDPQVDYEGKKILFSYRKGGTQYFHLHEINADGSGLRQLTDGPFDDFEPTYTAGGGIIFVSSRCLRWVSCWKTHVAIMYRCDADGSNIAPVSANIEHDNTPWPLPDGRILYMRWEYVDRSQVHYHHLWTMNPDGTGATVYFGNLTSGTVMLDAKPIAGTDKVVASFSPGHGREEHKGYVTVVSPKNGPDDNAFAKRITKSSDFHDPWAFGEDCFLAAFNDTLAVIDGEGNAKTLLRLSRAESLAGMECHDPRPLAPRGRERVIPPRVNPGSSNGRMVLANVYEGRNMAGVKRGEIKSLLVLETLPKPINFSGGMEPLTLGGSFNLERVLGTVPVEEDGSAYFEVPALRSVLFVALDERGLSVKRMQSFASVAPGETLGCVGCHEQRVRTNASAAVQGLLALKRAPSPIEPVPGVPEVMDFPRDVQPVLDRLCLKCHGAGVQKGRVDLSGDAGAYHSHAYFTLIARGQVADGRNRPQSNYPPRALGSSASPLMQKLLKGHHGVKPTEHDLAVIRTWIDAGAPYAGTYACLGTGMVSTGTVEKYAGPQAQPKLRETAGAMARRCAGCHKPGEFLDIRRRNNDYNLTRPGKSLLLLAQLAKSAGGLERCKRVVFTSTDDPDYRKILAGIGEVKKALDMMKRFDMPGFRPREEWIREMKRAGILPATLGPQTPIDPYETERKYWESLWYKPPALGMGGE